MEQANNIKQGQSFIINEGNRQVSKPNTINWTRNRKQGMDVERWERMHGKTLYLENDALIKD